MHRVAPNLIWLRLFGWLAAALVLPALPFLAIGWFLEPAIEEWLRVSRSRPWEVGILSFSALSSDVFLPVPSSLVCTTLGQILGIPWGTLVAFSGLQVGSWLGWWSGRRWGVRWIERICGKEIRKDGERFLAKWGNWAIVLTRPIPLIAESVTLLLGTHAAPYQKWLPALVASNLSLALGWCSLGSWSQSGQQVWIASMISILVPLGLMLAARTLRYS